MLCRKLPAHWSECEEVQLHLGFNLALKKGLTLFSHFVQGESVMVQALLMVLRHRGDIWKVQGCKGHNVSPHSNDYRAMNKTGLQLSGPDVEKVVFFTYELYVALNNYKYACAFIGVGQVSH